VIVPRARRRACPATPSCFIPRLTRATAERWASSIDNSSVCGIEEEEPSTDGSPDDADWLVLLDDNGNRVLTIQEKKDTTPPTGPGPMTTSGQVPTRHKASHSGGSHSRSPTTAQHLQAALAILTVLPPPVGVQLSGMPITGRERDAPRRQLRPCPARLKDRSRCGIWSKHVSQGLHPRRNLRRVGRTRERVCRRPRRPRRPGGVPLRSSLGHVTCRVAAIVKPFREGCARSRAVALQGCQSYRQGSPVACRPTARRSQPATGMG